MSRFVSPITDIKPNGSLRFFRSGTNSILITYKDELETPGLENPTIVPVLPNGNVENVFFSGSAKVLYLDEFGQQYAARDPVGGERELGNFTPWDDVVTYDENDIAEGSDGEFYKSLSNGNTANDPTTTPTEWEQITFIGVWNTSITYSIGDIVKSSIGNLWKALTVTVGDDPETDDGTNWLPAINELPKDIAVATDLVGGKSYVSTATASHVVPTANGGAPIEITWLDGTIMTLTSASNISVTTNTTTTDTSWVFQNFIQTLTLVDNGTGWEIK